eukprot:g22561.t1
MVQAFRGLDGMDQPAFPTGGRSGAAEIFERKSRTPRGGQGLEPCEAEEVAGNHATFSAECAEEKEKLGGIPVTRVPASLLDSMMPSPQVSLAKGHFLAESLGGPLREPIEHIHSHLWAGKLVKQHAVSMLGNACSWLQSNNRAAPALLRCAGVLSLVLQTSYAWLNSPWAAKEAPSIHSIPLKKQYVPVQKDGKTVAYKTAYFGEVHVGAPHQTFTVVFDTGSGHLILPSTGCSSPACLKHQRYNRTQSHTAVDIEYDGTKLRADATERDQVAIAFGTGEVQGEFVSEDAAPLVVC